MYFRFLWTHLTTSPRETKRERDRDDRQRQRERERGERERESLKTLFHTDCTLGSFGPV